MHRWRFSAARQKSATRSEAGEEQEAAQVEARGAWRKCCSVLIVPTQIACGAECQCLPASVQIDRHRTRPTGSNVNTMESPCESSTVGISIRSIVRGACLTARRSKGREVGLG